MRSVLAVSGDILREAPVETPSKAATWKDKKLHWVLHTSGVRIFLVAMHVMPFVCKYRYLRRTAPSDLKGRPNSVGTLYSTTISEYRPWNWSYITLCLHWVRENCVYKGGCETTNRIQHAPLICPKAKESSIELSKLPEASHMLVLSTSTKSWEGPFMPINIGRGPLCVQLNRNRNISRSTVLR